MSRFLHCAVLLLFAGTALAQHTAKKPSVNKPAPAQVAPDDMVIVITGACQTTPGEFAVRDCVRGVTRQEFEELVAALDPNSTQQSREKLAEALGQIIILSNEARKRGLPRDPQIHQMLRLEQMRLLANLLVSRTMKNDAATLSDTEIDAFYQEHIRDYQTSELLKIAIPSKVATGDPSDEDKAFAEALRTRCTAGEDPIKLQAEADQRAGQNVTPAVDLKNQRRSMFPAAQQSLLDLKQGECSPVIGEGRALTLYKVVTASTIPLSEARASIVSSLEAVKVKSELDALKQEHAISLNGKYFQAAPAKPSADAKPADTPSGSPPK